MLDDLAMVIEAKEVHRHVFFIAGPHLPGMQSDQITFRHRPHKFDLAEDIYTIYAYVRAVGLTYYLCTYVSEQGVSFVSVTRVRKGCSLMYISSNDCGPLANNGSRHVHVYVHTIYVASYSYVRTREDIN